MAKSFKPLNPLGPFPGNTEVEVLGKGDSIVSHCSSPGLLSFSTSDVPSICDWSVRDWRRFSTELNSYSAIGNVQYNSRTVDMHVILLQKVGEVSALAEVTAAFQGSHSLRRKGEESLVTLGGGGGGGGVDIRRIIFNVISEGHSYFCVKCRMSY